MQKGQVIFVFANYLDNVLVWNYAMSGFEGGIKKAGMGSVPTCIRFLNSLKLSRWSEASKFEEVIERLGVSSYGCRTKNLFVVVVDAALDVLSVDGHNPYEIFIVTTCIWYAKDLGPLHAVSLPSSLCFKVWTS
jgi:hypothetical protein